MVDIQFRVYGLPRPAGSKRAFVIGGRGKDGVYTKPKAIVTDASGKHSKTWKQDVKDAALQVAPAVPYDEPLRVSVVFFMPRPKAHYRTGKHSGELKPNAPRYHTKTPDASKLMRGTEDALTGIIWKDDSRIYKQTVEKVYTEGRTGAEISVLGIEELSKGD